MKKLALLLVAIIAIGLLATPYLVGSQAEQIYAREIDRLQQQGTDAGIEQVVHSYQRGLFGSQSRLELTINTNNEQSSTFTAVIESDISHGPVILTDSGLTFGLFASHDRLSLLDLPEEIATLIANTLGDNLITATTLVDFDQQVRVLASLQAFSYSKEDTTLTFGGANLSVNGDLQNNSGQGSIQLAPIKVQEADNHLEVSAANGDFSFEVIAPSLATGNFKILFDSVKINDPQMSIVLEQLALTTSQQLVDNKLQISENISIGNIISPIPLTGASYQFDLQGLSPSAVVLWSHLASEFNQSQAVSSDAIYQEQLRELISEVLQPGLELNQGLKLSAYGGNLLVDVDIRFIGMPTGVHPMDIENPVAFIDTINADLLLTADEQALMSSNAAPVAQLYLQQGLLVREADLLVMRGELRNGEFSLNEKPFPLREILEQQMQLNNAQPLPSSDSTPLQPDNHQSIQ